MYVYTYNQKYKCVGIQLCAFSEILAIHKLQVSLYAYIQAKSCVFKLLDWGVWMIERQMSAFVGDG